MLQASLAFLINATPVRAGLGPVAGTTRMLLTVLRDSEGQFTMVDTAVVRQVGNSAQIRKYSVSGYEGVSIAQIPDGANASDCEHE